MIDPAKFDIARDVGRVVHYFYQGKSEDAPGEKTGTLAGRSGNNFLIRPKEGKGVLMIPYLDVRFDGDAWQERPPQKPPEAAPEPQAPDYKARAAGDLGDMEMGTDGEMSFPTRPLASERPQIRPENITAPNARNHPASWEAYNRVKGIISDRCWVIIGLFGACDNWICDEMEVAIGWTHQSTSSLVSLLKKRRILYEAKDPLDSTKPWKRPTRSGSDAHVLKLAPRDDWDLSPDAPDKKGKENGDAERS